jgi:hypothetical protein
MSIRPDGQPDGQTRMKARCLGGGTPDGEGAHARRRQMKEPLCRQQRDQTCVHGSGTTTRS